MIRLIARVPDDRVVWAFSDPHGVATGLETALAAGLVDRRLSWVAPARTALVGCGDYLDRGTDSPRVVALLRRLEVDAAASGGMAVFARGNHEHLLYQLTVGASDAFDVWLSYGAARRSTRTAAASSTDGSPGCPASARGPGSRAGGLAGGDAPRGPLA